MSRGIIVMFSCRLRMGVGDSLSCTSVCSTSSCRRETVSSPNRHVRRSDVQHCLCHLCHTRLLRTLRSGDNRLRIDATVIRTVVMIPACQLDEAVVVLVSVVTSDSAQSPNGDSSGANECVSISPATYDPPDGVLCKIEWCFPLSLQPRSVSRLLLL
jgi:hypothetical protein